MTEENYHYRTNPMFLRNQFEGEGDWKIPYIKKTDLELSFSEDLRLIGFDKAKTGRDEHYNRIVHFFLYDYKFEDIWENPDRYIEILKQYRAVLTPDYSMYTDMNPTIQLYNTFRNRWVGAYLAEKGIKVIPTVSWGLENTFDFCFNGIEKGSIVAVSTYMVSEHGNHMDQKEFFMKGYNEMLKRLEPELIICYNTPFPEMRGNILFVDYDLSSWQHYSDDLDKCFITRKTYYYDKNDNALIPTDKGMGDSHGGKWKPAKIEDKRLLGKPGEIKTTYTNGKNGGYRIDTKIGEDGKAIKERHYTDHRKPWAHSNPHDHIISWNQNTGFPDINTNRVNYFDGIIPEFKSKGRQHMYKNYHDKDNSFSSLSDFKQVVKRGAEIEFVWKDIIYSITWADKKVGISEAYNQESENLFDSAEELLTYELVTGETLKEVILKAEITSRTL